ncbi:MAG: S8 family serine peptidase [Rhodothermales bacterium]|nr:S8 family serine peptidase [Rhodothermales bacterium]
MRLLSLLLLVVVVSACQQPVSVEPDPVSEDKFRNAHLVPRAQTAGKDGDQTALVFAVSPNSLLERYSILERYALLERYAIVERYEFLEAFVGFSILVNSSELDALAAEMSTDPDIAWIEPDFPVKGPVQKLALDPDGQMLPPTLRQVGADKSYTRSGDGRGSVDADIYIIDSGVSHPDINVVESRNFSTDPTADDLQGHGTHIAGIAAAIDDKDGIVGVAPGARVHNFKVFGSSGTADVSVVIQAIEAVIAAKKASPEMEAVINLSLGEDVGTPEDTSLDLAVQAALDAGLAVVVAAGNHGGPIDTITPAHEERAITVGAGFFGMDDFSGHGAGVDIVAPGLLVTSLAPNVGGVYLMDGTSASAAHVTGAVALYFGKRKQQTAAEAKDWILTNAKNSWWAFPGSTPRRVLDVSGMRR